jgi:hypothetical protein
MKRIILWCSVVLVVLALAAAGIWWHLRPQVITLKNGTILTLVQVTYGQHHHFHGVKTTGSRLRGAMTFDTTNDTAMVWIKAEHKPNQWPNYQLLVYDPANTACVGAWQRTSSNIKNNVDVQGFVLDGFPRRAGKMILRVIAWNPNGNGQQVPKGQFVVANPGPRSFPDWQPDPLPNTQSDGDLEVTLTHFDAAASNFFFGGDASGASNDPRRRGVQVALHNVQNGNVVTNWQPVRVVTSDATGNGVPNMSWSTGYNDDGDTTMTYQWGLWPDEKAWKLRVEMSRTSGFSSDETWSLANVPVQTGQWQDLWNFGPHNNNHKLATFAETTLGGRHLTISPVTLMTDMNFGRGQKQAAFRVSTDSGLPDGYRMTLLSATDEHGRKVMQPGWGPSSANGFFVFQLPDIRDAKSVNLTIALHQSRFVEFLVKPAK